MTIHTIGNNCFSTSATRTLEVSPDETPTVTANSDLSFCQGGSVTLVSSPAASYLWNDGSTTPSITVTQSGSFSVTIQGACQSWNSTAIAVNEYLAPPPAASNVTLSAPGTATLTASGNNMSWYDAPTGGNLLGTGPSYTTPFLSTDTVFYVQDSYTYGYQNFSTGIPYSLGLYSGNTTNAYEIFDVLHSCVHQ